MFVHKIRAKKHIIRKKLCPFKTKKERDLGGSHHLTCVNDFVDKVIARPAADYVRNLAIGMGRERGWGVGVEDCPVNNRSRIFIEMSSTYVRGYCDTNGVFQ